MSAAYFKAYPEEDTFLATQDGQFFTEKNKSQANSHAKAIDCKVITIKRDGRQESEAGSQNNEDPIELPEGNPTKQGWTIPQIQEWLKQREVKFTKNAKEDTLLAKVEEYLKAQESGE